MKNSTGTYGGAIFTAGNLTLSDTYFDSNTSILNGAAIRLQDGTAFIDKSTFSNNIAGVNSSNSGWGGAISTKGNVSLHISNSVFNGNKAYKNGGAVTVGNQLSIINSVFTNNYAKNYGGALVFNGTELNIAGDGNKLLSSKYGNNASYMGNSVFSGNTSKFGSDAITIYAENNAPTLPVVNLNAGNGGSVIFDDAINVADSTIYRVFEININKNKTYDIGTGTPYIAPTDGIVVFNNNVGGVTNQKTLINLYNGILQIGQNGNFKSTVSFDFEGGILNTQNSKIDTLNLSNIAVNGNSEWKLDVDLANAKSDLLKANSTFTKAENKTLAINSFEFLSDYTKTGTSKIFFSNAKIIDNGSYFSIADIFDENRFYITSGASLDLNYKNLATIAQAEGAGSYFTVTKVGTGGLPIAVNWALSDIRNYSMTSGEILSKWLNDDNTMSGTKLNIDGNENYSITRDSNILQLEGIKIDSSAKEKILTVKDVADWSGFGTDKSVGGAISAVQNGTNPVSLDFSNVKFTNNISGNPTTSLSSFVAQGGAISANGTNASLLNLKADNVSYSLNFAGADTAMGGAIYANNTTAEISNATFSKNSVQAIGGNANGGAVGLDNSSLSLTKTQFIQNSAKSINGTAQGGALSVGTGSVVTLKGTDFTQNTVESANSKGGAIYNNGTVSVLKGDFSGNNAIGLGSQGGAIYNDGVLNLTTGDSINITLENNMSDGVLNDIYQTQSGVLNIDGNDGTLAVKSGIAGLGVINKT